MRQDHPIGKLSQPLSADLQGTGINIKAEEASIWGAPRQDALRVPCRAYGAIDIPPAGHHVQPAQDLFVQHGYVGAAGLHQLAFRPVLIVGKSQCTSPTKQGCSERDVAKLLCDLFGVRLDV